MSKLKIVFCADGDVVSDFNAQDWADAKIEKYQQNCLLNTTVYVGTEHMMNCFVLRAMEGKLSKDNIEFFWNDVRLIFDVYDGLVVPEDAKIEPFFAHTIEQIVSLGYNRWQKDEAEHQSK
jgi:hypothetical protein